MSGTFNGYHVWLGIPPNEQPPNHYRLLGITPFETDADVIDHAADRQMAHVRTFQAGRHGALSQQILNELAAARLCLLSPDKKDAYDTQLRARLEVASTVSNLPLGKPVPQGQALPVAQPIVLPTAQQIPRAAAVKSNIATAGQRVVPVPRDDDDEIEVDLPAGPDLTQIVVPTEKPIRSRKTPAYSRSSSWQRQVGMLIVAIVALGSFYLLYRVAASMSSGELWKIFSVDENTGATAPGGGTTPAESGTPKP